MDPVADRPTGVGVQVCGDQRLLQQRGQRDVRVRRMPRRSSQTTARGAQRPDLIFLDLSRRSTSRRHQPVQRQNPGVAPDTRPN
jgi:hypothetical protein